MAKRSWIPLENSPSVMTHLAHHLGISQALAFHDVYSLHDPDLLAMIPRPVYALLVIIPMTETWRTSRSAEDAEMEMYTKSGPDEPVVWFKQTTGHMCGSIGLLHCVCNGDATGFITLGSELEKLLECAIPLKRAERTGLLVENEEFYQAHQGAANQAETASPDVGENERLGQHFVAFVKGKDSHLWELEGSRKGPLDRGLLEQGDDVLSKRALQLGLERLIEMESQGGGDLRFSCIALAPSLS